MSGTIRWGILAAGVALPVVMVLAVVAFRPNRSQPVIPKGPEDAIEVVVKGLADNQPEVVWAALPAGYQQDIREVIATFSASMDAEIYDRTFRILDKVVKVLREKEEYFAKSAVALSIPMLESSIGKNWSHDVGLLDTIAHSDLSSLARLQQMDPGIFLATTGREVMAGLEELRVRTQRKPGANPWEKVNQALKESQIQFVKTTESQGYLKMTSPTNSEGKVVQLSQVEGRWVPADLAASWETRIAEAKERLSKLSGPEFAKYKPMVGMVLDAVETGVDSLLTAGSQNLQNRAGK
jgi:hypothetical protein